MAVKTVFLCCCFCAFTCATAGAEVIKLNSGQTIEGKILKQDKDSILVDAGIDTPVTYFRDEIKEVLADAPAAAPQGAEARAQADALEAQAVDLIDQDKMDEGLDLVRQALALDPSAQRHMNYGSILFGNGVADFKAGDQEKAKVVLHQAEEELNKAITGFNKDTDSAFVGQAYFLLGEMYANAFADPAKSQEYYKKAVAYSGHEGAKAALEKLAK